MTIQDILDYAARNQGTININVLKTMLETLAGDSQVEDVPEDNSDIIS